MGRAKPKWTRLHDGLAPGVVMCHETMVAGWKLRAELVLHSVGTLQIRVNNQYIEQPMMECTLASGRRHYQAVLKRLTRPRQATLPI
ncbi:MAG: hypothetical protein K0R39_1424 [Symbiobacteriaceae bacterium]|jgi:hypothetical protein|nr:hypothetical protein [Symbiobacteriaceae bacterium]